MRKLALSFLTIISLFFLPTPSSAQEACTFKCPAGYNQSGPTSCTNERGQTRAVVPACASGKTPSNSDPSSCICNPTRASGQQQCTARCPSGTSQINSTQCASSPTGVPVNLIGTCPAGFSPNRPFDLLSCSCIRDETPPEIIPPAPNPNPGAGTTTIGGQQCKPLYQCQSGYQYDEAIKACVAPQGIQGPPPTIGIDKTGTKSCPANTCPSSGDANTCVCTPKVNNVCPTVTGCTPGDKNCTEGGGLRCNTADGRPVSSGGDGIRTAIGCIPTDPQILIESIIRYGTFAGGGVAFLLMLLAAIQMITAEGNPNVIKASQEKFYSAIIGLLLIIFSVLLLQVIGVDLLGLRGFGS